jgi:predicted nucleic-acid-binding Zn-ribbon protein
MSNHDRCAKCGSDDRIPGVHVHGGFHARSLKVEVVENPKAWLDKGIHEGMLTATVCGKCGLTELYVKNPAELAKAYRQKKSQA